MKQVFAMKQELFSMVIFRVKLDVNMHLLFVMNDLLSLKYLEILTLLHRNLYFFKDEGREIINEINVIFKLFLRR